MGSMSVVSMAELDICLSAPSDSAWYYTSHSRTIKNAAAVPKPRWVNGAFRKRKKAVSNVVDIVYNVIFGGVSNTVPRKSRNVLPPLRWLERVNFQSGRSTP